MKMLGTVVSGAEAKLVADLVDLIDVKDPSKGSLGAPDQVTVHNIRMAIGSQGPLSVAMGDIDPENPHAVVELGRLMAGAGATMLKVGLTTVPEEVVAKTLGELKKAVSENVQVAAVAYADAENHGFFAPARLPILARDTGLDGIMIDTFTKAPDQSSLDYLSEEIIKTIFDEARKLGLRTALAGGLDMEHIDEVVRAKPDIVGFRTAITSEGEREKSGIDRSKINKLKMRIRIAVKKWSKPANA
ncbi:MAG: (5-formylfuran-3-yl)methyl phosphate synthase [Nitrospinota bacterium]|nr:(5-formylfuran-3-yl)methyl phosphate synthase [Nitrospinota bacterium]